MRVAVSDAKAQLTELVRRAEAGDEVVLTRHGQPVVRLSPLKPALDVKARIAALEEIRASARGKATPGPDASRGQDFLYDEDALPT